jgi:hypothetical protein
MHNPLVGCWHLVGMAGVDSVDLGIEVEFRSDGRLFHSIQTGARWQLSRLVYRIEGDTIISDQLSAPEERSTRFTLEPDGRLRLDGPDSTTWYRRGPKRAPEYVNGK